MKVVLLETGRGNHAGVIADWRERIGLTDDDSITLLSWYPPREVLPVERHIVFGPMLRLRTHARSGAVLLDEIRRIRLAAENRRRLQGIDVDDGYDERPSEDDEMQAEDDLAEQLPESMLGAGGTSAGRHHDGRDERPRPQGSGERSRTDASAVIEAILETAAEQSAEIDAPADQPGAPASAAASPHAGKPGPRDAPAGQPATDILSLPKHHPARVKAALRWRARRLVRTARRSHPLRRVPAGVRRAIGGIPNEFALTLAGWQGAPVVVGNADLVLSLDSRSQKAAWVLARRVHGPAVVVSYPAAKRVLQQRRADDAG